MRMWKVHPKHLCNQHLLGEHLEMHQFAGCIIKNKSIAGYIKNDLVEPQNIQARHDQLADELLRRNMNHRSPLPPCNTNHLQTNSIPIAESIRELIRRCPDCRKRFYKKIERSLSK